MTYLNDTRHRATAIHCIALILIAIAPSLLRAQEGCDDASVKELLRQWGVAAAGDLQIRDKDGHLLVDHVGAIARTTVFEGERPAQALRVTYRAGGICRDTTLVAPYAFTLHGDAAGASHPVDIPILPAGEFACDELLETNSPVIGGDVAFLIPTTKRSNVDLDGSVVLAPSLTVAIPISNDVEIGAGAEVFVVKTFTNLSFSALVRWMPFGGRSARSDLRYVPGPDQFLAPAAKGMHPSKSLCSQSALPYASDSTVFVAEERSAYLKPFVPYFYAGVGYAPTGGFASDEFINAPVSAPIYTLEEWEKANDRSFFVERIGIGLPIVTPIVLGIEYRHMRADINAVALKVGVELR